MLYLHTNGKLYNNKIPATRSHHNGELSTYINWIQLQLISSKATCSKRPLVVATSSLFLRLVFSARGCDIFATFGGHCSRVHKYNMAGQSTMGNTAAPYDFAFTGGPILNICLGITDLHHVITTEAGPALYKWQTKVSQNTLIIYISKTLFSINPHFMCAMQLVENCSWLWLL